MLGEKVRILLQKAHKRSEFGLNSLKKVVRKRSYFDKSGSYFIFGSTACKLGALVSMDILKWDKVELYIYKGVELK